MPKCSVEMKRKGCEARGVCGMAFLCFLCATFFYFLDFFRGFFGFFWRMHDESDQHHRSPPQDQEVSSGNCHFSLLSC